MSKDSNRRTFTKEFKVESVQYALSCDKPVDQIARDLGIHSNNLRRWIAEYKKDNQNAFPGVGNVKGSQDENYILRKKLADAEMERDILKKALAIFSRPSQ